LGYFGFKPFSKRIVMGRDWYFNGERVFDVPRRGVDFERGEFTKKKLLDEITALINSCESANIQFATQLLQHFGYFLCEKDPNYYEYLNTCEDEKYYSFNTPVTEIELYDAVEQFLCSVKTFDPNFKSEWVDDSFKVIEKFINGRDPSSILELEIEQFATDQYNCQLEEYKQYIEDNTEKVMIDYN